MTGYSDDGGGLPQPGGVQSRTSNKGSAGPIPAAAQALNLAIEGVALSQHAGDDQAQGGGEPEGPRLIEPPHAANETQGDEHHAEGSRDAGERMRLCHVCVNVLRREPAAPQPT